ncbi:MAG: hypothetical protein LBQ32_05990 [Burkholderiaceae bacterium]|jgi:hypothetical protein|nr:hypothetical protein [Burkholderiaceae bacterium]
MNHYHTHDTAKQTKHKWIEKSPGIIPLDVQIALRKAMRLENISPADFNDLLWIMAQESGGVVGASNPKSTARGLFQLYIGQYKLNPNGEKSFGNPIEECQGGIHYIYGRYHTVKRAKEFWKKHYWY